MLTRRLKTGLAATVLCGLGMAWSPEQAQATPVQMPLASPAASSPLLDYVGTLLLQDPNFVEQAAFTVLSNTSFMEGDVNPGNTGTPEDIKKFQDAYKKKVSEEVEKAIKKMIDDFLKEIQPLPPAEPLGNDVVFEIIDLPMELLVDPYSIIEEVKIGTFKAPKKLRPNKPPKIKPKVPPVVPPPVPPVVPPVPINLGLQESVDLLDEQGVAYFRISSASFQLHQAPTPSTRWLTLAALAACLVCTRAAAKPVANAAC